MKPPPPQSIPLSESPVFETASVLFMDIVKYSLQPIATQGELLEILQQAVLASTEFQKADGAGDLLRNPTGDGMALVFFRDLAAPVRCALEIAAFLKRYPALQVRMGVNIGPVSRKADVNQKDNVVGEGINIAQRVMDCGDAGHILLSSPVVEALNHGGILTHELQDFSLREVKHGVLVHIHNLCTDQLGNRALPTKLCPVAGTPQAQRMFHAPARPPLFVGREAELGVLRERLRVEGVVVPVEGLPGLGKTTLALEFAHRYKLDFEAVYWLQCVGRDLAALASELAFQLGVKLEGDLETILTHLRGECGRKRCLLVLDNVEDEAPGRLIPDARASVLVTTRRDYLEFLAHHDAVKPELFTEEECLRLFRRVVGEKEVAKSEAAAKVLFDRLGYLPIAISVAAGLVKHDRHYTIGGLAAKLPPLKKLSFGKDSVGTLLNDAIAATGANEQKLLTAMAVCAAEGFRLALAAEVAELAEETAVDAMDQLVSRSLVEELERDARRYRLHALVRAAGEPADALRMRHAEAILKRFETWESDWRECEQDLGDLRQAFGWTLDAGDDERRWIQCCQLAYRGLRLTERIGRLPEAYEFCESCAHVAAARGDKWALQAWYGNQALILKALGRLEEALVLHKKEEAICEELGNRDGLPACYGNQALILKAWGRLEEALALHQKEEGIWEELGNRNGLQASYGNQAVILKAWGRLEEALALLKKQEAICEELGNRDGLQISYGNQALILQAWGRLEEALALHKKEEAICEELGLRCDLAYCYWNMGDLALERGDRKEARTRAEAALSIFTELNMPRKIDDVKQLIERIGEA